MLKKLFGSEVENSVGPVLQVIVVPAEGLAPPLQWADLSGAWLKEIVNAVPEAHVWEYQLQADQHQSLAVRLQNNGLSLLEDLAIQCSEPETSNLSIVFVCHGTGSFILKKALQTCREAPMQYRPVIDAIAGALFLGAPHLVGEKEEARITFETLMRLSQKGSGRSWPTDHDVQTLLDICRSFDRLNVTVPVISVYESKATPIARRKFAKFLLTKSDASVIAPEPLCRLNVSSETVIDGDCNHLGICNVPIGSPTYQATINLLKDVVNLAMTAKPLSPGHNRVPTALKDQTLRSQSTTGKSEAPLGQAVEKLKSLTLSLPLTSQPGATGGSSMGSFECINKETALEMTTRDPKLPCFSMDAHDRPAVFQGREDIFGILDQHLLPLGTNLDHADVQPLRSFAVCALGGMGKTQLAVEYAYSRREEFEAIFWLVADDETVLATNFGGIAHKLGLEDESQDLAASRDIANGWLSSPWRETSKQDAAGNEVPWLIIFDNVDNLDTLSDYWPKTGRGSVLVTSRDPGAKQSLYVRNGLDLGPLSTKDSEELIQNLTHVRADGIQREALTSLAQRFGGLPLALRMMAGVFKQLRHNYVSLLKFYDTQGAHSRDIRELATLWSLDGLGVDARTLLKVLSILDPDNIPNELLIYENADLPLSDYPTNASSEAYYTARAALLSSSLISTKDDEKIALHRLTQDTARAMMSETELFLAYHTAIKLLLAVWPVQSMEEHHSVTRLPLCKRLFPCVVRLKDGVELLLRNRPHFLPTIEMHKLFNDAGWYLFEIGLPEQLKSFCGLALGIGERLQQEKPNHLSDADISQAIGEAHGYLGIGLVETNEHELSMKHKQRWLDMLLQRRRGDGSVLEDYELGYAYNEIGVSYGNNHQLHEASKAFERSIETFQKQADYRDVHLSWPQPNLGFIYWMQGRLDDAEQTLLEILAIHAAEWGFDDTKSFKTGKILYGLGNVLEDANRYDESLQFHRRCLDQYKKTLGDHHHRMGDICHRMAKHCMRLGLLNDAQAYLDRALKIFASRVYLINELARTTYLQARLFSLQDNSAAADESRRKAHELRQRVRPQDRRSIDELADEDFDVLVAFWSR